MYKTGYHAKYFAHLLTIKNDEKNTASIGRTFYDSSIELNPHQIEAALFALQQSNQKGAILADEVGLGKTIEAGLVISQSYSEMKQQILVIAPTSLLKQWQLELSEKFSLPTLIIDGQKFKQFEKAHRNPFKQPGTILLTSYQFAANKRDYLEKAGIDLVVFDEAHKLRNLNKTTKALQQGLVATKKVLLTATPLQNSGKDLYNLCHFIDSNAFGGLKSFNFLIENDLETAKEFLGLYLHRRLRSDVSSYLKYPNRYAETYNFSFTPEETRLYQETTKYLQNTTFFETGKVELYATILRKQLGSSTPALISVLEKRIEYLRTEHRKGIGNLDSHQMFDESYLEDNDLLDTLMDEESFEYLESEQVTQRTPASILEEIQVIDYLISLAKQVKIDSKALKLIEAIQIIYQELENIPGIKKKVLIFTESRKTQDFLFEVLTQAKIGNILRFSGKNDFPEVHRAFQKWQFEHPTEVKNQANIRKAIVENFRTESDILIATEAASEGLNLQFCSVVINYDLPWNPQRIEQRIGRCHRYGQEFDVTVFNFLNANNQVEFKIHELLDLKFKVFSGLLGSSDEILGLLEQGSDLEKKLMKIYLNCRTKEEIDREFELLSQQFSKENSTKLAQAQKALLENFDEDVANVFKKTETDFKTHLHNLENYFWEICKILLQQRAHFNDETYSFELVQPHENTTILKHQLNSAYNHRPQQDYHPLRTKDLFAKSLIQEALVFEDELNVVTFDLSHYPGKIGGLEPHVGSTGYLKVAKLKVSGKEQFEKLLVTSIPEGRCHKVNDKLIEKLFYLDGTLEQKENFNPELLDLLNQNMELKATQEAQKINMENNERHKQQYQRINREAIIQQKALNQEILDLVKERQEIDEIINQDTIDWEQILELEEKRDILQSKIKKLRQELTDREDEIEGTRRKRLKEFQTKLEFETEELFVIKYNII